MRHPQLSLCVLTVATAASAQVVATAPMVTSTVLAGSSAASPVVPGTNVWSGLVRSVTGAASNASLALTHDLKPTEVSLQWQLSSQAISNSVSIAEAEVRFDIASTIPQTGELIIDWSPTLTGTGLAALTVDVFDDGVVDAQGSATVPVMFDHQSPLILRVNAGTSAQAGTFQGPWGSTWTWSGGAAAQLSIRFVPTHAQVTTVAAQACSPTPTLQAVPDLHEGVELQAIGLPNDQLALFALGFQPMISPLPLSAGCSLLVDPVVVVSQPLQPATLAHQPVPIPLSLRPTSFLAQLVTFRPISASLTAGDLLRIDIQ